MTALLPRELIGLVTALVVFAAVSAVALGLRHLAFRALYRWAAGTHVDQILLRSLRLPSIAWCLLIGIYAAVDTAHLPPRPSALALNVVYGLLVLSVTAALANLFGAALGETLKRHNLPIPATGLSLTVFKVAIWVLGTLVLLSSLGVSVAPILTALGVGGLAVALALQETLSNCFAGLHLLIEKPIRVGDFVKLETGQEGYVVDIGWRTTRIRTPTNNMVIMPNTKLTQSILTNYSLPQRQMALPIPIGVSYRADPEHVGRVLLDEAKKAVGHVPGLLDEPEPQVRFIPGFGDFSLNFTLTCRCARLPTRLSSSTSCGSGS